MNNIDLRDRETLSAYLDNELNPADRTQLEQRLAQEVELQQALAKLEQGDNIAKAYFSELDNKPLPMNLEAMILNAKPADSNTLGDVGADRVQTEPQQKTATILNLFGRSKKAAHTKTQSWGFASAASIVFALGIWMLMPATENHINANLLAALNTEPSGTVIAINPELKVEIIASYQDLQDTVCRALIEHSPQQSSPAMACFEQGHWQIERSKLGDAYQTASSSENQNKQGLMTAKQERLWLLEPRH